MNTSYHLEGRRTLGYAFQLSIIVLGLLANIASLPLLARAENAPLKTIIPNYFSDPVLTCPASITVNCTVATTPDHTGMATATADCGEVAVTFSDSFSPACGVTGIITRTWIATDDCGASSTCIQFITITDNSVPILVVPDDAIRLCGEPTTPVETGIATATVACDEVSVTYADTFSPSCGGTGTIIRTWTATSGCGTSAIGTQTITVTDTISPTISYSRPSGSTVDVECNLADENWTAFAGITAALQIEDNCATDDVSLTLTHELVEEGICGVSDFLSIWQCTWTATDICGNSGTFNLRVRIVDTTGPIWLTFPEDQTIACDDDVPLTPPTTTDNCSSISEITFSDQIINESCTNGYTIRRQWTAIDGCGNSTTDYQNIAVADQLAPTIIFTDQYISNYEDGQDIYVDCSEYGLITQLDYAVHALDNCSDEIDIAFTYEDFGQFDCSQLGYSGYIQTRWTATDACGNATVATLNWLLIDQTPPRLLGVPDDVCVSSLPTPPVVEGLDECDFVLVDLEESSPIACEGGQYIERTWTATDACGNATSETQRLFISDTQPPRISINYQNLEDLPSGSTGFVPADCSVTSDIIAPDLLAAVVVTDGCSGDLDVDVDTNLELLSDGGCVTDGFLARYLLEVTATDLCGNIAEYELFIHLVDATLPEIIGPTDLIVGCGEEPPAVTATDECGEVVDIFYVGTNTLPISCATAPQFVDRFWLAIDGCGNTNVFEQHIAVVDDTGPVFDNLPESSCGDLSPPPVNVRAIDECTGMEVEVSMTEINQTVEGCGNVMIRRWTAVDSCGNTSVATRQIVELDDQAPELNFTDPLLIGLEDGDILPIPIGLNYGSPEAPLAFEVGAISMRDNCTGELDAIVTTETLEVGGCAGTGFLLQQEVKWLVSDPCGNASSLSIILAYIDHQAPEILDVPAHQTIYCEAPVPDVAEVRIRDNYDQNIETTFTEDIVGTPYGMRLIRIWTATDDCGNFTEARQRIDVYENDLVSSFSFPEAVSCNTDENLISIAVDGGTPPYTYNWDMIDCDGFITSDPTGQTISYTLGYSTQNFTVTITDANGCEKIVNNSIYCQNDDFAPIPGGLAGGQLSAISIYPNPVSQVLIVQPGAELDLPTDIYVYNLLGQRMYYQHVQEWPQAGWEIDASSLPNGAYWVHINPSQQAPIIREVVVQH